MRAVRVRRVAPRAEARRVAGVRAADYSDGFLLDIAALDLRAAQRWARATFEEAPEPVLRFLLVSWRLGLGLRLGPLSSPDHVLGWVIERRTSNTVVLRTESRLLGTTRLVWQVDGTDLRFTTLITFRHPASRLLWAPVAPLHRFIVARLLARAASDGLAGDH